MKTRLLALLLTIVFLPAAVHAYSSGPKKALKTLSRKTAWQTTLAAKKAQRAAQPLSDKTHANILRTMEDGVRTASTHNSTSATRINPIPAVSSAPQSLPSKPLLIKRKAAPDLLERNLAASLTGFSPVKEVLKISYTCPDMVAGLAEVRKIQFLYGKQNFFDTFAIRHYKTHFPIMTPHLLNFFQKITSLKSRELEDAVVKRIDFLVTNKSLFLAQENLPADGGSLRLRYMNDISNLTPETFSPASLVYSYEKKLHPKDFSARLRHVNAFSNFYINGKKTSVYQFNKNLAYLPQLYRFLLAPDSPRTHIQVVVDFHNKHMAIYNKDRTLWLRISQHEFSNPKNLHIHLNELKEISLRLKSGKLIREKVLWNLSIPLAPVSLEAANRLYSKFVLFPAEHFTRDPYATVERGTIF